MWLLKAFVMFPVFLDEGFSSIFFSKWTPFTIFSFIIGTKCYSPKFGGSWHYAYAFILFCGGTCNDLLPTAFQSEYELINYTYKLFMWKILRAPSLNKFYSVLKTCKISSKLCFKSTGAMNCAHCFRDPLFCPNKTVASERLYGRARRRSVILRLKIYWAL